MRRESRQAEAEEWIVRRKPRQAEAEEWIVYRDSKPQRSWQNIESQLQGYRAIRIFGPHKEFLLVRGTGSPVLPGGGLPWGVKAIQPNYIYSTLTQKNADPDFGQSWGLVNTGQTLSGYPAGLLGKDVGAESAWEIFAGSHEVVVAILDSGIDQQHEELKNQLWRNEAEKGPNGIDDDGNGFVDDIYGWNFISQNNQIQDDNGHGSFCAGIVGARSHNGKGSRGVLSSVRLMSVKCLDSYGFGTSADAIAAITYSVEQGASVINASWGGTQYDLALYATIQWASDRGVLFVAAAGNNGSNNDEGPSPIYPASFNLPNVVSVAAYDNRDRLWNESNYGKRTVHLGAPGVGIFSTALGGYAIKSGTSYAAPFVTGVAALLKGFEPGLSLGEWRERLLSTTEVIGYYQKEKSQTAGRVYAYNALKDIRPRRPEEPLTWSRIDTWLESSHPYPNGAQERYSIEHSGATHIRVHFKRLETEACCDRVMIKDAEGEIVEEYAGERQDFWSADALGDTIVIELNSDYLASAYGFEIDAYEISFESTYWSRQKSRHQWLRRAYWKEKKGKRASLLPFTFGLPMTSFSRKRLPLFSFAFELPTTLLSRKRLRR